MLRKLKQRLGFMFIALTLLLAGTSLQAMAATTTSVIAVPYGSIGWSYQEVPYDGGQGFETRGFDASSWSVGQAGFGTTDGTCSWNNPDQVKTAWTPGTDMLLRRQFSLPASVSGVHIEGVIDNNADIYINGKLVQHVENGFCGAGGISVDVPEADLFDSSADFHNLLAIRARDLGQADFVDVQISYLGVPTLPAMDGGTFINVRGAQGGFGEGCTTAYSVSMSAKAFMLTAKHCIDAKLKDDDQTTNANVYKYAPVVITTTDDKYYFNSSLFCSAGSTACILPPDPSSPGDMVAFAPDAAVPTNKVQTADGLLQVLGERAWGDLGKQKVCHWGAKTFEHCGTIASGQSPNSGMVVFGAKGAGGDSGGPVYIKVYLKNGQYVYQKNGRPVGVYAIGMTVLAGGTQCYPLIGCLKDATVFIPMPRIEDALGVKLLT